MMIVKCSPKSLNMLENDIITSKNDKESSDSLDFDTVTMLSILIVCFVS